LAAEKAQKLKPFFLFWPEAAADEITIDRRVSGSYN
jgi:hypothetical protein